jgi:hypothetical protein
MQNAQKDEDLKEGGHLRDLCTDACIILTLIFEKFSVMVQMVSSGKIL